MEKIKVGLIRCDVHGYWYSLLFAKADPMLLFEYQPVLHYYFFQRSHPADMVDLRDSMSISEKVPHVDGMELARIWDPDRKNAEEMAKTFLNAPKVCDTVEEVLEDIDLLFIADCQGEGKDHLEFASYGLKKGIPTFVDKPFAFTYKDARTMVDLAEENNAPLMSASLLRINPLADCFRNRFTEIAPVAEGFVKGVGNGRLGSIFHSLSLAQNVFGVGVEAVECMGKLPLEFVHLHYPDSVAREVVVMSSKTMGPCCGYRCEAYGRIGAIHSNWINDFVFPQGGVVILEMLKEMVRSRKPQLSYDSMLELMKIIEAARISQANGSKLIPV